MQQIVLPQCYLPSDWTFQCLWVGKNGGRFEWAAVVKHLSSTLRVTVHSVEPNCLLVGQTCSMIIWHRSFDWFFGLTKSVTELCTKETPYRPLILEFEMLWNSNILQLLATKLVFQPGVQDARAVDRPEHRDTAVTSPTLDVSTEELLNITVMLEPVPSFRVIHLGFPDASRRNCVGVLDVFPTMTSNRLGDHVLMSLKCRRPAQNPMVVQIQFLSPNKNREYLHLKDPIAKSEKRMFSNSAFGQCRCSLRVLHRR